MPPVHALTADNTAAFYPPHWSLPVGNTSAQWDLEEIRSSSAPGDLLCFSGAHLHASVPNTSGLTRFSVETRTVNADDVQHGRAAANVDGAAPHVAAGRFRSVTDGGSP